MKLLFTSVMLIIIVSVSSAQVTFEKKYNYSVFPETIWTNIYSLPGMPVFSAKLKDKPDFELNAFPNPAENSIKVAYSLPENVKEGTLFLFDNNVRFIERFVVDRHTDHL